ncbi:MAG: hypothetical protein MK312_13070, partial [Roseibacillus sp.]|nr:hypothetical protein [Roseibacillus sp.]
MLQSQRKARQAIRQWPAHFVHPSETIRTLLLGAGGKLHTDFLLLFSPAIGELHLIPRSVCPDLASESKRVLKGLSINVRDDVIGAQASLFRRASVDNSHD